MRQDKTFERQYSVNIARLRTGTTEEVFEVNKSFFEYFPHAPIQDGEVTVRMKIEKSARMLDVHFHLSGHVLLACDRCLQLYEQPVDTVERVIYSFDPDLDMDEEEVVFVNPQEPQLSVLQECYDFVMLSAPMRKVPPPETHICAPEVLALIKNKGDEDEEKSDDDETPDLPVSGDEAEESKELDPRWEALRKLKDQMKP